MWRGSCSLGSTEVTWHPCSAAVAVGSALGAAASQTTGKLLGFTVCIAEPLAERGFWHVLRRLRCRRQLRVAS